MEIYSEDNPLDVIVFNAAGGLDKQNARRVNSDAKIALARDLNGVIAKAGGLGVEIESGWSRFHPLVEQLPSYEPVAISKKRGRDRLLKELPEVNSSLTLAFVCGHAIEDTATMKILKREMLRQDGGREKWEKLVATAEGGKLPNSKDMARAVLETIAQFRAGNLKFGQESYVGIPNWDERETRKQFSMYGPTALYVDSTVFHTPDQNFTETAIKPGRMHRLFTESTGPLIYDPGFDDDAEKLFLGGFTASEGHAKGHFTRETGLQIVPGYKLVAAAELTYARHLQELFGESFRWDGNLGETKFLKPVLPGVELGIYLGEEFPVNGGGWSGNLEIKQGEIPTAQIYGVLMNPGIDRNPHFKARTIEIAAQAAGAQFIHKKQLEGVDTKNLVPLFKGIGPIDFSGVVKRGDTVWTETVPVESRRNGFKSNAILRVDDRVIATIDEIDCGVLTGGQKAIERIKKSITGGIS